MLKINAKHAQQDNWVIEPTQDVYQSRIHVLETQYLEPKNSAIHVFHVDEMNFQTTPELLATQDHLSNVDV